MTLCVNLCIKDTPIAIKVLNMIKLYRKPIRVNKDIAIRNLDYILTVSAHAIATASVDILANLEKSLDVR